MGFWRQILLDNMFFSYLKGYLHAFLRYDSSLSWAQLPDATTGRSCSWGVSYHWSRDNALGRKDPSICLWNALQSGSTRMLRQGVRCAGPQDPKVWRSGRSCNTTPFMMLPSSCNTMRSRARDETCLLHQKACTLPIQQYGNPLHDINHIMSGKPDFHFEQCTPLLYSYWREAF